MFHMMNGGAHRRGSGARPCSATPAACAHSITRATARRTRRRTRDPNAPQILNHRSRRCQAHVARAKVLCGRHSGVELVLLKLVDDERNPRNPRRRITPLDILLPIARAGPRNGASRPTIWRSRCTAATATRDFPVEQFYRDNRLNRSTKAHGIRALVARPGW